MNFIYFEQNCAKNDVFSRIIHVQKQRFIKNSKKQDLNF